MILLFIISIIAGIFVIAYEKRAKKENDILLDDFISGIRSEEHTTEEKLKKTQSMLLLNGYKILDISNNKIEAKKRRFSLGWFLIWLSLGGIGAIIYLLYHFFIKRNEYLEVIF